MSYCSSCSAVSPSRGRIWFAETRAAARKSLLWKEELADETRHPVPMKALKSMCTHWEGLTLFVDHPNIPMDNNEAERRLRNPVVGRKNYYGSGRTRPRLTSASDPREPITLPAGALGELLFRPVITRQDSLLWNELIERYHYLGYKPLPGAQIRYLVFSGLHLLAVLGFGAAAWTLAPRDRFIGWTGEQRVHNLHLSANNARFLILPWVTSQNLASRILAGVAKCLPHDWQTRYGYRPVLLETFVEQGRFRGTCYRAAKSMSDRHKAGESWIDTHVTRSR